MTDDLTAQIAEIFLDLYDAWNNTTCEDGYSRTTYEEFVAPRIAACMQAVMEKTATMNWPVLRCTIGTVGYDAEQECLAAGLQALRGET